MMWNSLLEEELTLYTQYVQETDKSIRAFLEFDPCRHTTKHSNKDIAEEGTQDRRLANMLVGLPIAVKDNIAVASFQLSCASRMLENVTSPYTASAVQALIAAGTQVVGKTNLDEFAMGATTYNSAFQKTCNPWDIRKVPGGSSGGSAAAVASGMVPLALGTDTGGSVRQPAAFCGIYALKPTYGSISRYGLVAYASSLDVIGMLAESVDLLEAAYCSMAVSDTHDMTSQPVPAIHASPELGSTQPARIGVSRDFITDSDGAIHKGYDEAIERLTAQGHEIVPINLPKPEYGIVAYYIIATAEASANLARYDGIRYGHRSMSDNAETLVRSTRSEAFGQEVKLRILLGTFVLRSGFYDQYYVKAQQVRSMIRTMYNKIFQDVDALLLPVSPTQAHDIHDVNAFHRRIGDRFTVPANLTGMPALAFPVSMQNGLPLGMQIMGPTHSERVLCNIVRSISTEYRRPPKTPGVLEWIRKKKQ